MISHLELLVIIAKVAIRHKPNAKRRIAEAACNLTNDPHHLDACSQTPAIVWYTVKCRCWLALQHA